MHEMFRNMQKYAVICIRNLKMNMQEYAEICNRKYASHMQVYAGICSTKSNIICNYMHIINMEIYAKYMQLYELYGEVCNPIYMQNMQLKICKNMSKYATKMQKYALTSRISILRKNMQKHAKYLSVQFICKICRNCTPYFADVLKGRWPVLSRPCRL